MEPDETPPSVLPERGQRAHVRLVRWAVSIATVVDEVDDGVLVVRAPLHLAEGQGPARGERLLVTWEEQSRPYTLPCAFLDLVDRDPGQWRVLPDGVAKVEQRRRHVRATSSERAVIVCDDLPLAGALLDVSEGGLRCRLDDPEAVTGVGDLVSCVFRVGAGELELRGQVVQVHLELGIPRLLAICFVDITAHQADELRHHVFVEQAHARSRSAR